MLLWILLAGYLAVVGPIVYLTRGEPPTRTAWKSAAVLLLAFLLDIPVNIAALRLSIGLT